MQTNPLTEEVFYDYLKMMIEFHGWDLSEIQQAEICSSALTNCPSEAAYTKIAMALLEKSDSSFSELVAAIEGTNESKACDDQIRVAKLVAQMKDRRSKHKSLSGMTDAWKQIIQSPVSISDRQWHGRQSDGAA